MCLIHGPIILRLFQFWFKKNKNWVLVEIQKSELTTDSLLLTNLFL